MIKALGDNTGIATALNIGMRKAYQNGASHCILFDQDSLPDKNMVAALLEMEKELIQAKIRIAAIGPLFIDKRTGDPAPFIEIKFGRVKKTLATASKKKNYPASYLISSGSLIRRQAIEEIGKLQDDLFIDYVDIEWGLRASQKGHQCFGCGSAIMHHTIGDKMARIPFIGKQIPLHSPKRDYYLMRNAIYLYRNNDIPLSWKIADGLRLPLRFLFYALSSKNKTLHIKMMCMGILHGFLGRMGRHDGTTN